MGLNLEEFGRFLRSAREQSKVSIRDFAHICGISTEQTVGRLELAAVNKGVKSPSYEVMERVLQNVNQLSAIKNGEFVFDGYSSSLIATLNRYRDEEDRIPMGNPSALPDGISTEEGETAYAIITLMKTYPELKSRLRELHKNVNAHFTNPMRADYSDMLNDLTKRTNTAFYFGLNEMIRRYAAAQSCTHICELLIFLIKGLNDNIADYADKDAPGLSHSEQQERVYRRRKNSEDRPMPESK